jgi:hypothetical protein
MADWDQYEFEAASTKSQTEQERADFSLISQLGLSPRRDGNMWCFLWGKDLQEGVAGFGPTVRSAAQNFLVEIYKDRSAKEGSQ